MKMCIHYLLGRCEFVITLKFALIIPLSCKAMMYIGSMENGHANINFMLYLCHLFVTCVIIVFRIWRLASVLDPSLWPLAFWFQPLAPAAGPSRWPLASNLEPSLSKVQEIKPGCHYTGDSLNTKSGHQLKVVHDTSKHSSLFHQLQT